MKTQRPALLGETETDVCIIGAGYTGLSTALFLLENGFKVSIVEAAKVGFGASGLLKDRLLAGEVAQVFASANMEHPQAVLARHGFAAA